MESFNSVIVPVEKLGLGMMSGRYEPFEAEASRGIPESAHDSGHTIAVMASKHSQQLVGIFDIPLITKGAFIASATPWIDQNTLPSPYGQRTFLLGFSALKPEHVLYSRLECSAVNPSAICHPQVDYCFIGVRITGNCSKRS
jgi:hypothetical protein